MNPGDIDVNTGLGGLYVTWFSPTGFYVNAAAYGGGNSYESNRLAIQAMATGSTSGAEVSTWTEAGWDAHLGNFTVGPAAAFQYTYVSFSGFNEHGSLIPLNIQSDSQDSIRTDVGARAAHTARLGNISIIPNVYAAWEHEYRYSTLGITGTGLTATTTFFGPPIGHNSAVIMAGVSLQLTPTFWINVGYQGNVGRENYNSNGVNGGFSYSF